ncbi:MAG: hypothetical protein IKU37_05170 [Candidatus Gastranaerophilales bacterium]|nr:hypothetical protein [Candidatus Gastranaerophilales bacterium]
MQLSKLTQVVAGTVKEISSKKTGNVGAKVIEQAKTAGKNVKGALAAMAVQGRAMVNRLDITPSKKVTNTFSEPNTLETYKQKVDKAVELAKKELIDNGERPAQNCKYIIDTSLSEKFRATVPSVEEMANRNSMNVPYEFSEGRVQNLLYGDSKGSWTPTYKSAQDSAEWMKSQFAFKEMIEPGLSHKSAKESAEVIMKGGDTPKQAEMRKRVARFDTPELKAKKAQMDLKRELKAKHADKLQ